jgi:hypothetical protein
VGKREGAVGYVGCVRRQYAVPVPPSVYAPLPQARSPCPPQYIGRWRRRRKGAARCPVPPSVYRLAAFRAGMHPLTAPAIHMCMYTYTRLQLYTTHTPAYSYIQHIHPLTAIYNTYTRLQLYTAIYNTYTRLQLYTTHTPAYSYIQHIYPLTAIYNTYTRLQLYTTHIPAYSYI